MSTVPQALTDPAVPAVEIGGLVKRYGQLAAVDGLSLSAARGAVTGILGPNGAGKTTTIEICEGYRRPDQGTVRVLGLDPVRDAKALRPRGPWCCYLCGRDIEFAADLALAAGTVSMLD